MSYSKWIYVLIASMLAGGLVFDDLNMRTGASVLRKGCDYWEGKGMAHLCTEELIKQYDISKVYEYRSSTTGYKCSAYGIKTNNQYCNDLIITKCHMGKYYSMFAFKRNTDDQKKAGYKDHEIENRNECWYED